MADEGIDKTLSERGEDAAARFLEHRGYEILERNWACEFGAVPLIARDEDSIVYVEVATTLCVEEGFAEEPSTKEERKRIEKIAASYLRNADIEGDLAVRFDVIDVLVVARDRALLRHHINAWGLADTLESEPRAAAPCSPAKKVSAAAEQAADRQLELGGFEVIDRDWTVDGSPVWFDRVAKDSEGTLVFLLFEEEEGARYNCPGAREKFEALAASWLSKHVPDAESKVRFDAVSVSVGDDGKALVRHLTDCFA